MNNENDKEEKIYHGNSVGSFFIEIIKVFLLAVLIIMPIRIFLFQPFFVQGASMEPTFKDGQYLIVNEIGYKRTEIGSLVVKSFKAMNREDIVVFHYPRDHKLFFIKRIIGLPGEKVQVKNGRVYIYNSENPDGFELEEKYLPKNLRTIGDINYELGSNEYFVMGDNRNHSSDSRIWGPISDRDIVGKVFLRAWPLNNISLFLN